MLLTRQSEVLPPSGGQRHPVLPIAAALRHNYRVNRVIAECAKILEVFLPEHRLDDFFGRDGRADGP
jgi:hypothetical protein